MLSQLLSHLSCVFFFHIVRRHQSEHARLEKHSTLKRRYNLKKSLYLYIVYILNVYIFIKKRYYSKGNGSDLILTRFKLTPHDRFTTRITFQYVNITLENLIYM